MHVHDHSCTRKEPHHSRHPVSCSSRATSNRDRRSIDGRSDGTRKPVCGCVNCNIEASGRDQSYTTRRRRVSSGYALRCRGLAQPPILVIGIEAVLASAELFDNPERATPRGGQTLNPDMHTAGNAAQAAPRPSVGYQVSFPGSVFRLVAQTQSAAG